MPALYAWVTLSVLQSLPELLTTDCK